MYWRFQNILAANVKKVWNWNHFFKMCSRIMEMYFQQLPWKSIWMIFDFMNYPKTCRRRTWPKHWHWHWVANPVLWTQVVKRGRVCTHLHRPAEVFVTTPLFLFVSYRNSLEIFQWSGGVHVYIQLIQLIHPAADVYVWKQLHHPDVVFLTAPTLSVLLYQF